MDLNHHAYCLIGGADKRDELLATLKKNYKLSPVGNPDFFDRTYESFTIDNARELKSLAETRPVTEAGKKIFIILANTVTIEAQNALLKLLEEPPSYAHFYFVIPSAHILLPTVKSRIQIAGDTTQKGRVGETDAELTKAVRAFLAASPKVRFDQVKALMDDITKEKKTKQDAIDFLHTLEIELHAKGVKKNIAGLDAVLLANTYATDRAPSIKMLLEYVSMNV